MKLTTNNTSDTVSDYLNYCPVVEIKEKLLNIQNLDETDLETFLSLAAEAGNALLTENQKLEQGLLDDIRSKTLNDMETKTSNNEAKPVISSKSFIFAELAQVKRRHDQAEEIMKTTTAICNSVSELSF
ncbi:hypothetical protein J6590_098974 [Homalodisca vitripennis]|nr:hypothetical protein J6590_098974 [Homalodisca vitripennis]